MGSSTVQLYGVDLHIGICKFTIAYKQVFLYDIKQINMRLDSVVTLECSFICFRHNMIHIS